MEEKQNMRGIYEKGRKDGMRGGEQKQGAIEIFGLSMCVKFLFLKWHASKCHAF